MQSSLWAPFQGHSAPFSGPLQVRAEQLAQQLRQEWQSAKQQLLMVAD